MSIEKRYNNNKTKLNENNKIVYRTILYPKIDPAPNDIWIVANKEDRLDSLAYKYYKDTRYWWIIAQANQLGKGSMAIPPSVDRIRIPKNIEAILADFDALNKNR